MTQGLLNQHMASHLCRTSLSLGIRQPTVFHNKTVGRHTGACHLQPAVYIQDGIGGSVTRGINSDPPTPPNDGAHGLSSFTRIRGADSLKIIVAKAPLVRATIIGVTGETSLNNTIVKELNAPGRYMT